MVLLQYLHRGDPESLYAAANHLNQSDGYCESEGTEEEVKISDGPIESIGIKILSRQIRFC